MKLRSRRRNVVRFALLGAAACMLPLVLAPAVAYLGAVHDMRSELSLRGIYVLDRTEAIFGSVEQALADNVFEARRGCEDRTLQSLAVTSAAFSEVSSIGIARNGFVKCDSVYGRAVAPKRRVLPIPAGVLDTLDRGTLVVATDPGEPDGPIMVATPVGRSDEGGRIVVFARIPAVVFAERFDALVRSSGGMIDVAMGHHSLRVGPPSPSGSGEPITVRTASDHYPISIAVGQSWTTLMSRWLPISAGVIALGLLASGVAAGVVIRRARARLSPEGELRSAIAHDEFRVVYLPTVDLASGLVTGAEALVRWEHPEQGTIRPDLFIPLAEETGLIVPITEIVMRRVAAELGGLLATHPDLHVSINLAPVHLADTKIVDAWAAAFAGSGIRSEQVVFEVTERGMVEDEPARGTLDALRARGAAIAIDDFGTGYCSLAYLQRFRIDCLKIDRSFVEAIGTGSVGEGVLVSIIDLAHRLGLETVAEGVERAEQAAALREKGVGAAQGWHFSKPLDAADFSRFVLAGRVTEPPIQPAPPAEPAAVVGQPVARRA